MATDVRPWGQLFDGFCSFPPHYVIYENEALFILLLAQEKVEVAQIALKSYYVLNKL